MNLAGGRTRDGGNIVGASVFYSNSEEERGEGETDTKQDNPVDQLDQELKVVKRFQPNPNCSLNKMWFEKQ